METGARTILIVDDEKTALATLSLTLQKHGFTTITAISEEEALGTLDGKAPVDLVMVDIDPGQGLDGLETAKLILQRHHLPLLLIFSCTEPGLLEKAGEVASYGFVAMDSEESLLAASVRMALGMHQAHQERGSREHSIEPGGGDGLDWLNALPVGVYRVRIFPVEQWKEDAWLSSRNAPYELELVNEPFLQILGLSREDFRENPGILNDLVHPDDREAFVLVHQQAMANPVRSQWEGRIIVRGKTRWVHFESTPQNLKGGEVRWTGSLLDITGRKEMEEALRESEVKFRGLVESTEDWVWAVNIEGLHTYSNNAPAETLGYTDTEIAGNPALPLMHPDDARRWAAGLPEHAAARTGWRKERIRWLSRSGEIRHYESTASPVIDASGKVTGFQGIDRDITDRLKMEEELRASHENLAATLNALPDLLFEVDTRGVISSYYAPAPSNLFTSPEAFLGKSVGEILPEKPAQTILQAIQEAADLGRHQGASYSLNLPDGERWFELSIASKGDNKARDQRFIVLARDITERRKSEERVKESLREKELLLKEIHHRVKNNMQIITSLLSLQERKCDNPGARAALKESRDRIRSIAMIHEKIYRSENLSYIRLEDFVRDITSILLQAEGRKEISLVLDCADVTLTPETAIPLSLIVNELVTNALKHAFPGEKAGTISIHCGKSGEGHLLLSVRDDGAGFPEDTDIHTEQSLGMVLVKALASQIQGTMEMDREKGTTFTLRFPVAALPGA